MAGMGFKAKLMLIILAVFGSFYLTGEGVPLMLATFFRSFTFYRVIYRFFFYF